MANCREQAYSNDYYDFIIPYGEELAVPEAATCTQRIDEGFDIFYYPRMGVPGVRLGAYTYLETPNCYGLLDRTALEVSGIIRMQNQPALELRGNGVLVGFIDTGIDYTNPLFRYADGSSRITAIWDQTIEDGTPPEGISYGAEYRTGELNEALRNEEPFSVVPSRDTDGHGTFLAGVACGGEDAENDFIGAVPQAQIAVVKLKQAKRYLREFYFIPESAQAYQENDIMMGVAYLNRLANTYNMPLVICLALGNSMGGHGGEGYLNEYLEDICNRRKRSIVTATGNEANARHHFQGNFSGEETYVDTQINVEDAMPGFFVELWAKAPELYSVAIISPTGEELPRVPLQPGVFQEYRFVFEGTTVSVDYRLETQGTASQLAFIRFMNPSRGLWIIRVYPQNRLSGSYNMWLPMQQLLAGRVFFLRSTPDITLTSPGSTGQVITVGGYRAPARSIYVDSGRGYPVIGGIKPDFVAPAVDVFGPGLRGNFITYTGTSAACAITAGAVAQIMEWAIVKENRPRLSNAGIKNILIRGADRASERVYPNREWGAYGNIVSS